MKKPNLNGPESVPLLENIHSLPLTVTIFDDKDNVVRKEEIEFSNREHRKWLGKITVWSVKQGYIVETSKGK